MICEVLRCYADPMQLLSRLQENLPAEIYGLIVYTLQAEMNGQSE
jgi:hypothetical protein